MSLLEGIGEAIAESGVGGAIAAAGAVIAAPMLLPALRPVAKELVKGGMIVSDKVKSYTAEGVERWSDLVAEVRSEMDAEAG